MSRLALLALVALPLAACTTTTTTHPTACAVVVAPDGPAEDAFTLPAGCTFTRR